MCIEFGPFTVKMAVISVRFILQSVRKFLRNLARKLSTMWNRVRWDSCTHLARSLFLTFVSVDTIVAAVPLSIYSMGT